ncbi:unnamed protein product [Moneuplotes crassus]|uniref:Uncharacterized protein n=1 Tax=Euplotes crassus TaxID=5936 RepID=A0AAD1XF75_EUPCR|nr:unnamed protein product [Moneuplotes crassus]
MTDENRIKAIKSNLFSERKKQSEAPEQEDTDVNSSSTNGLVYSLSFLHSRKPSFLFRKNKKVNVNLIGPQDYLPPEILAPTMKYRGVIAQKSVEKDKKDSRNLMEILKSFQARKDMNLSPQTDSKYLKKLHKPEIEQLNTSESKIELLLKKDDKRTSYYSFSKSKLNRNHRHMIKHRIRAALKPPGGRVRSKIQSSSQNFHTGNAYQSSSKVVPNPNIIRNIRSEAHSPIIRRAIKRIEEPKITWKPVQCSNQALFCMNKSPLSGRFVSKNPHENSKINDTTQSEKKSKIDISIHSFIKGRKKLPLP